MSNFTVKELKQQLRSRNLPVTGLKADLINRLQTNSSYQSHTRESSNSRLSNFTVLELKDQLRARNLPVTGIKTDLINRLETNQTDMSYKPQTFQRNEPKVILHSRELQTVNINSKWNTAYERPMMDGIYIKPEAHAANSTNIATRTFTDHVNMIQFEGTKTMGAAKITNMAARSSTNMNTIQFERTETTKDVTEVMNATAGKSEAKTVGSAIEATNAAGRSCMNVIQFEDIKTAGVTEATNTTEIKTIANATETINTAKSFIDDKMYSFGPIEPKTITSAVEMTNAAAEDKTVANATEAMNKAARSTVNENVFQFGKAKTAASMPARTCTNIFEDIKPKAGVTEATNTTAETKTIASTTAATNAAIGSCVDKNIFRFGRAETVASTAEATNMAAKSSTNMNVIRFEDIKMTASNTEATNTTAGAKTVVNATETTNATAECFTDINTIRFEGTKMAADITEEKNAIKHSVDVYMIWRQAELNRREKELAERELMLARKEIEMLRQAAEWELMLARREIEMLRQALTNATTRP